MSVLTGKELRIVGFLCNWCSYGGADTAGTANHDLILFTYFIHT